MNKKCISVVCALLLLLAAGLMQACAFHPSEKLKYEILIGESRDNIEKFQKSEVLVIDAQYFSKSDISYLKENKAKEVYSYLNIGSIETFRDYYEEYSNITLGQYEKWPEEEWIDVSDLSWQEKVISIANELLLKGIDGFFIDNVDVYYYCNTETIFEGIVTILNNLSSLNSNVIVNGGDSFVLQYIDRGKPCGNIFCGINQESVFTEYDFEKGKCTENDSESRDYLVSYLQNVQAEGFRVFVIEYADNAALAKKAEKYIEDYGWTLYISDNIELKINK